VADELLQPDDPQLALAARHALHDEELIAAFAVDGDAAEDPARAKSLIERCAACRDLHADMVAIGAGLHAAGPAAAMGAARTAPRDFRLTAADAERLRPGFRRGRLDGIAARLFGGIATFGRPLGATLATFGVVGLLVGSVALGPLGGSPASGPGDAMSAGAPGVETLSSGGGVGNGPKTDDGRSSTIQVDPLETDLRENGPGVLPINAGSAGPSGIAWLFGGSIVLLVLGLALLASGARRRRGPPRGARS
jgi:hypothetical protein